MTNITNTSMHTLPHHDAYQDLLSTPTRTNSRIHQQAIVNQE